MSNILARIPRREWQGLEPTFLLSGKFCLRANCAQCGGHQDWKSDRLYEPSAAVKRAKSQGWRIAKRIVCPTCQTHKEKPIMNASVTPLKSAQTPDVRQQRRDAHTMIELYYDLASSTYKDRYSDEKIAKETGLPKEWVAKRREDEFGPIKEPNDLAVIRQEVATAKGVWEQAVKKLDDLCVRNGWRQ